MNGRHPFARDTAAQKEAQLRTLESLLSKNRFPNRSSLRVHEVAEALQITVQHVRCLAEEFRDTGGKQGLPALNLSSGDGKKSETGRNATGRGCWRIAVSDYDEFLRKRLGI